jgi:hypothetical protein
MKISAFYYPKMCTRCWRIKYGSWRDSLAPNKGQFQKSWWIFIRFGWAAWTLQIVKRVI